MNDIQGEIEADHPSLEIQILGVNEVGHETGNATFCDGRDLPWLQDVPEVDVWGSLWSPTYRDVVVLDDENRLFGIYNVTEHDLTDPVEAAGLRAMLLAAAGVDEDE